MREGSAIGRVRGLGSAKSGAHHWWLERLTSGSPLLLTGWLLAAPLRRPDPAPETRVFGANVRSS